MPSSAFTALARLMQAKHDEGVRPYVLFLGTAASLSSGCSTFSDIVQDIVGPDDPANFFDFLDRLIHNERALLLKKHLQGSFPSPGYRHLAELIKAGYFDVILTTNVDSLLENSLTDAGLRPRDYVCMINGKDRDEEIAHLMQQHKPRVKILKLHGDLHLGILPITPAETFQFSSQVSDVLREHLNRDVLIVGYGPWDTHDVNRCLELSRQSLWYVAPDGPDQRSFIYDVLVARRATRNIICGEEGQFDRFFELLRGPSPPPPPMPAQKLECHGPVGPKESVYQPDDYPLYEVGLRQLLGRMRQDHLNELALSALGVSFNELCGLITSTSGQESTERLQSLQYSTPTVPPEYVNFDLEIRHGDAAYVAQAACPLAGETKPVSFMPPFTDEQVELFVLRMGRRRGTRKMTSPREAAAQEFGGTLFQIVFQGPLRDCLMTSLSQTQGLRLRLRLSGVPELADWPWEYLYPGPEVDFFALSRKTPIVRYCDVMQPVLPLLVERPLHILAVIASPRDLWPLDVNQERRNLETALEPARRNGQVVFRWLAEPTPAMLRRELASGVACQVLHFIGHGGFDEAHQDGFLAFVDERGDTDPVYSTTLARTLADCDSLRLVVLNSCDGARGGRQDPFGSVAATLIRRGLPAAVAMQFEISDTAAITFSTEFYRALGQGWPVDTALTEARVMMALEHRGDAEWGTPVLYLRAPDGRIFDLV